MSKAPRPMRTYRSESGRYLDIHLLVADCKKQPGLWLLAYPSAPHATYLAIRAGQHRDLRALTDGRIDADWRNEYIEAGARRGDVFCRWVPEGWFTE